MVHGQPNFETDFIFLLFSILLTKICVQEKSSLEVIINEESKFKLINRLEIRLQLVEYSILTHMNGLQLFGTIEILGVFDQ
jgi:hypothetical protein